MLPILLLPLISLMTGDTTARCLIQQEKYISGSNSNVDEALRFLEENNKMTLDISNKEGLASWNYQSNLTEENKQIMLQMTLEAGKFAKESWKNATSFSWKQFKDSNVTIYKWFKDLSVLGTAALADDKFDEFNRIKADMEDIYGKAKVCRMNQATDTDCDLPLEPDLTELFIKSRDYEELKHVWSQWRDATGKVVKDKFLKYIDLANEASCLNGFSDYGELWLESYDSKSFKQNLEELWQRLKPFYMELHAYVRRKLIQAYPDKGIKPDGPIPAHLLGNMWAQTWGNIFDIVKPYPDIEFTDVSKTMNQKNMTILDMFKMSEEFFTSLGLIEMTPEFWNRSILEKPKDREMVCHASAWDFYDGKDVRIKMCTRIDMEDLITVHHEMGHIEYYLQYANQPAIFRSGANPGFHEAVGDTIALSVSTPQHLKKIGLLESASQEPEADINTLMKMALDKIAFVPFGYLIDSWRWKAFDGSFNKDELNYQWWEYRLHYQGLCPPVKRTNDDLDAAAKYHVIADVPYIRYFVSYVVQFQFHKALCDAADYTGPLHKCDIYQNKKAGKLLSDTLKLGSSVPWEEALSIITEGKTNKMDAQPMIEYFEPLFKWLKKQNENEYIGWKTEDAMICP